MDEWAARWKPSAHFPACGACGGTRTKEHAFEQTWCRGRKRWTSEAVCLVRPRHEAPAEPRRCTWTARRHLPLRQCVPHLLQDCHAFTLREYADPDFKTPEEWDKEQWTEETREQMAALRLKTSPAVAAAT